MVWQGWFASLFFGSGSGWEGGAIVMNAGAVIIGGIGWDLEHALSICRARSVPNLAHVRQLADFWPFFILASTIGSIES